MRFPSVGEGFPYIRTMGEPDGDGFDLYIYIFLTRSFAADMRFPCELLKFMCIPLVAFTILAYVICIYMY